MQTAFKTCLNMRPARPVSLLCMSSMILCYLKDIFDWSTGFLDQSKFTVKILNIGTCMSEQTV